MLRNWESTWKKHKGEILSGIIAALITALVTIGFNLYETNHKLNTQYYEKKEKEIILSIKNLRFVESDLEKNLELLLQVEFLPKIEYEKPAPPPDPTEGLTDQYSLNSMKVMSYFINLYGDSEYYIKDIYIADESFQTLAYEFVYKTDKDLDFKLQKYLIDIYNEFTKIKNHIKYLRNLTKKYSSTNRATVVEFKKHMKIIEKHLLSIKKDKILYIKGTVSKELKRLNDELKEVKSH